MRFHVNLIDGAVPSGALIRLDALRRAPIYYAPAPVSRDAPSGATAGLTARQEHERSQSPPRQTGSSGATSRTTRRPAFARQPGLLAARPRVSCSWTSLICSARPRDFCEL